MGTAARRGRPESVDGGRQQSYRAAMPEWLAIEVTDAAIPASAWQAAHEDALIEAALTHGARTWEWHRPRWGVVLELAFDTDEQLERFRGLPVLRSALDAVPDPVSGLLVYRGRGGGAGASVPRRPRPRPVAGAAALPAPEPHEYVGDRLFAADLADDEGSMTVV
jgi:hypothetical protein